MTAKSQPRSEHSSLFARWFWLVYLPLGLLIAFAILMITGVIPKGWFLGFALLGAYGAVATRLLLERRKKGLAVPPPRSIIIGIGSVVGILLIGSISFVVGMDRLSTNSGLFLAAFGGFLMLLSVTVPTFKIVDSLARRFGRKLRPRPKAQTGDES